MDLFIRYCMDTFFVVFGAAFVYSPGYLAGICPYFKYIALPGSYGDRLHDALLHRKQLENLSPAYGAAIGWLSIGLGAICIASKVPVTVLYAMLCIGLALVIALAFVKLRTVTGKRLASLRARDPQHVAPPYMYVPGVVAALMLGSYLSSPVTAAPAIMVAASSLAMLVVAWRVSDMPALISGEDVPVEQFIDDRLRTARTIKLIGLAGAPLYVFAAFSGFSDTLVHFVAFLAAFIAFVLPAYWQYRLIKRPPSSVELSQWSHGAV